MAQPNGKKMDNLYKLAWVRGLKTTYYLRSLGATHVEKSTLVDTRQSRLNAVNNTADPEAKACLITDPTCESCQ
jgi:ribonucleoside-diphosphate reductase alpha chain